MSQPGIVVRVRFATDLTFEQVQEVVEERLPEFEALAGLRQKYYLQDPASGEYAGLYVWDSREAFDEFRESELRATIGKAYRTRGEPQVEVYRILRVLREDRG